MWIFDSAWENKIICIPPQKKNNNDQIYYMYKIKNTTLLSINEDYF